MPKRVKPATFYKQKKRYCRKHTYYTANNPSNRRYTEDELHLILDYTVPDVKLAKFLNRSIQAIWTKRAKLRQIF